MDEKDVLERLVILENKQEYLEKTLMDKITTIQKSLDEIKERMSKYMDEVLELERRMGKYNGYSDKFATKQEVYEIRDNIGEELGNIYDRISVLEKDVEAIKVREMAFRSGESFIAKYWLQILTIILTILMLIDYFKKIRFG